MFSDISKITFFEAKLSIRDVSFCMHDKLGLQIRIRGHFLNPFDFMSPLAFSKFLNKLRLKSSFFEVSPFAPFYVSFRYICL